MWPPESHSIRIVNWNARSVKAKRNELCKFLEAEKIDIGIITETRLNRAEHLSLPLHSVVQLDRPNSSGGGVAILIRHNIRFEELPDPETIVIQAKGINIHTSQDIVTLFAVYAPQQCKDINGTSTLFADDLTKLTNGRTRFVVAGDLNARHTMWRNSDNNKNGRIVAEHLGYGTCNIHFPDKPTFLPAASTIDVFLSDCRTNLSKPVTYSDSMGSDHLPVVCELLMRISTRPYCGKSWIEDLVLPLIANVDSHLHQSFVAMEEAMHAAEAACRRWHDLA